MEVLGVDRARELDRVRRAADVDVRVALGRRRHVVERGEVEEVLDLAAQLGDLLGLDAEQRRAQVADDGLDAFRGGCAGDDGPAGDQLVETLARRLADEHVDLALAFVEQRSTRRRPMKPVAPVTK